MASKAKITQDKSRSFFQDEIASYLEHKTTAATRNSYAETKCVNSGEFLKNSALELMQIVDFAEEFTEEEEAREKKPKKPRGVGGRPRKITKAKLHILNYAFIHGASDEEACLCAGIAPATLYEYQLRRPEFKAHKQVLKKHVQMQAKFNISKAIGIGDVQTSKWALERLDKENYSVRTEHSGTGEGGAIKTQVILDDI